MPAQVCESGCQFRFHSVFMKRFVIPSNIMGCWCRGKALIVNYLVLGLSG